MTMKLKEAHVVLVYEDAEGCDQEVDFHLPPPDFVGAFVGSIKQARDLRPVYENEASDPSRFEEVSASYTFKFNLKRRKPKALNDVTQGGDSVENPDDEVR